MKKKSSNLRSTPSATQTELINDLPSQMKVRTKVDHATNTIRLYRYDWEQYEKFCNFVGLTSIPGSPTTVSTFLLYELSKGMGLSTLSRRLAAIYHVHRNAGVNSPHNALSVQAILDEARKDKYKKPKNKCALTEEDLLNILNSINTDTLRGLRDRAILLVGYSGAIRRSELVALTVKDFKYVKLGAQVTIKPSRPNRELKNPVVNLFYRIGNPCCPLAALSAWLEAANIHDGPIFRRVYYSGEISSNGLHDCQIARIVKKYTGKAGLPSKLYSGHSLRRGSIMSAVAVEPKLLTIANQARFKSLEMIRCYTEGEDSPQSHTVQVKFRPPKQ